LKIIYLRGGELMGYSNLITELKSVTATKIDFSILNWFYDVLVLPFNMEAQTQTNWCWAATSKSVSVFYSRFSPWTQCKIASSELNQTCCQTTVPSACNVSWYLDKALTRTNNFVSIQSGTVSWSTIKNQLELGLVVGARIGWNGGGGHFMVIRGVTKIGSIEYLHIDDPIYGKSTLTYSQFANNYQSSGSWTHTYFTKKYFYFMWFKELIYSPALLKPIPPVKPLLTIDDEKLSRLASLQNEFNLPHHTFILELDKIKTNFKLPEEPRTLRVFDLNENEPIALYELALDEKNPELIQMNSNPAYFKQLDEGLGRLKNYAEKSRSLGELRFIRIPALNIEAFWLHYDNNSNDVITPIKILENDTRFDGNKSYNVNEFKKVLLEIAKKVDTKDDLLGA
jgi:Papain-like cysteine protease AvrRpt2